MLYPIFSTSAAFIVDNGVSTILLCGWLRLTSKVNVTSIICVFIILLQTRSVWDYQRQRYCDLKHTNALEVLTNLTSVAHFENPYTIKCIAPCVVYNDSMKAEVIARRHIVGQGC